MLCLGGELGVPRVWLQVGMISDISGDMFRSCGHACVSIASNLRPSTSILWQSRLGPTDFTVGWAYGKVQVHQHSIAIGLDLQT